MCRHVQISHLKPKSEFLMTLCRPFPSIDWLCGWKELGPPGSGEFYHGNCRRHPREIPIMRWKGGEVLSSLALHVCGCSKFMQVAPPVLLSLLLQQHKRMFKHSTPPGHELGLGMQSATRGLFVMHTQLNSIQPMSANVDMYMKVCTATVLICIYTCIHVHIHRVLHNPSLNSSSYEDKFSARHDLIIGIIVAQQNADPADGALWGHAFGQHLEIMKL